MSGLFNSWILGMKVLEFDELGIIFNFIFLSSYSKSLIMESAKYAGEGPLYKKIQNYIFKFEDLLGQGNFSKVYKAKNQLTNEIVAIKIIELQSLKSKKLQELLFSEIDVLKKLNHPNVLKCFEVFTSNRHCYIITELCNEGDLESKLRKQRRFSELAMEPIVRDIFEGLIYLAEKNVIHRDLKVANVFIHNSKAKIADFGFAKFTKQIFKDINIGSPIYMSPEGFINNIYGPKTDVWAFGVMLFELLHGETPYAFCKTQNQLKYNLSIPLSAHKFRQDVSYDLRDVILRCMEIDEAKRITIFELAKLPYFKRLLSSTNEPKLLFLPNQFNSPQLRVRSPSYNQISGLKMLKSEQGPLKRKVSVERFELVVPQSTIKNHSQGNQYNSYQINNVLPSYQHAASFKNLQLPFDSSSNEKRSISTKKILTQNYQKNKSNSSEKEKSQNPILASKFKILSSTLTFKESVNILHYARLIFKFVITLKVSEYSNENELVKLSRWLMELLEEINQKIIGGQILYEGENSLLREQKLKEVRGEYEKKYKNQLSNYVTAPSKFGDQGFTIQYMINYCFNLYQKYDSMIAKEGHKTLITLGNCIIMIYEATKILGRCFKDQNYEIFQTYKDVENYLGLPKDQINLNSYYNYKKKMIMFP